MLLGGSVKSLSLVFGFMAVVSLPAAAQTSGSGTTQTTPQTIRVNCGGGAYTDANAQVWQADTGYNSGNVATNNANIAGTANQTLFHSTRYGFGKKTPLIYTFPVAAGSYHVNLYFAETSPRMVSVGARVFNVKIAGNMAFQNLDVFAAAGANSALVKSADAVVTDGQLTIELDSVQQDAEINAIEITQTLATPQLTLNFVYPDGTPVSGALNYNVTTTSSSITGNQPLTSGQVTCLLVSSPQLLGLVGAMNVNLSLTDTAGNSLWQIALTLNPASANFAAVQSSSLNVVVQKH
jgi:Malectin domain